MSFFSRFMKGQDQGAPGESTSLLSDWNSYSTTRDVEPGSSAGIGTSTGTLFKSAEATNSRMSTGISGFFQNGYQSLSQGITSGVAALPTTESFSIPSGEQLLFFFGFLAAGGIFLVLSFLLFLPVIIISPSKFAMSFTLGCLCIMAGFSSLRGWKQQLVHMTSRARLPFSAAYIGSIVATLYAALIMKSYILSLVCSGLQVVALLYYIFSYFPGGAEGVKFMLNMFYNAVARCCGSWMKE